MEKKNTLDKTEELISDNYNVLNQLRLVYDLHVLTIGKASEITKVPLDVSKDDVLVRLSLHTLFTIASLDLLSVLSLHKKASISWEKILLVKSAYLTIYESIKAFEKRKINLRKIVISRNLDIAKFDKLGNELRTFKRTFDYSQIDKIRNKTAGHIDDDFKDYFDTLINMDINHGLKAVLNFLEILELFGTYMEELRRELNIQIEQELVDLQKKTLQQLEMLKKIVEKHKE